MGNNFKSFVNGAWIAGETRHCNINPSNIEDKIGEVHYADQSTIDEAIGAARSAQQRWSKAGILPRANVLDKAGDIVLSRRDRIGDMLAREEGKTLSEAIAETTRAGQILKFFAAEAVRNVGLVVDSVRSDVEVMVNRTPLGVVAAIAPWNFPIAIPAWKTAPALAYGNAVVLKTSELTPASACSFVDALREAGLPPGVVNLVQGDHETGAALVGSDGVDAVTFTGSMKAGGSVALQCAARGTPFQLEMGGKNPLVILNDADIDIAVQCALDGAFFSAGQRCTASSRLIVQNEIYDPFVKELSARLKSLTIGNARDPDTQIGPLASEAQLARVSGYLDIGRQEAGAPMVGGHLIERTPPGYFLEPTLFVDTDNTMRINREEIFGPVASVIRVKSFEAALEVANDTTFGLSAGICTRSLKYSTEFRRRSAAGMVMVNLPTAGVDFHVPFGGIRASSMGPREQGAQAREFYTQIKTTYLAS